MEEEERLTGRAGGRATEHCRDRRGRWRGGSREGWGGNRLRDADKQMRADQALGERMGIEGCG